MQNCSIGDSGARDVAAALKLNRVLTSLNLEKNSIGGGGALELATALATNTSLGYLYLRSNAIAGTGGCHLAAALMRNAGLRSLDLSMYAVGPEVFFFCFYMESGFPPLFFLHLKSKIFMFFFVC